MKNLKFILSIIFVALVSGTHAGSRDTIAKPNAETALMEIKNGALLVRLQTKEHQISQLEKAGHKTKAAAVRNEQRALNKEIVMAFKQYYTFSPVYFFYSSNTKEVVGRQFEGIFLNDSLEKDASVTAEPASFYIAEISEITSEETSLGVDGLHLLNPELKQLDCSFGEGFCSVRAFNVKKLKTRTPEDYAKELNRRFHTALR